MEGQIDHWSHPHPLTQCTYKSGTLCSCCNERIYSSNPDTIIYGCSNSSCDFYLHKSPCSEFPQQIQNHPLHPNHTLTPFQPRTLDTFCCSVCLDDLDGGFIYRCDLCHFNLHALCSLQLPAIKLPAIHHHYLSFLKFCLFGGYCKLCGEASKETVLKCVPCGVLVHVNCVSTLPETAKISCHRHVLNFSESLDDTSAYISWKHTSEEFYCDACEKQRVPTSCGYVCVEPDCSGFVAHPSCAIPDSEIIAAILKGAKEKCFSAVGVDEGETAEDPFLLILDERIAKLESELEELTRKLKEMNTAREGVASELEHRKGVRAEYLASSSSA